MFRPIGNPKNCLLLGSSRGGGFTIRGVGLRGKCVSYFQQGVLTINSSSCIIKSGGELSPGLGITLQAKDREPRCFALNNHFSSNQTLL